MSSGYIYLRSNEFLNIYDSYKLGKSSNIPDREKTYITSEVKRGIFAMVIELNINIMDKIEKDLQKYFNSLHLHVIFDGGIEFYKKEIINLIIPYLHKNNIIFKNLSKDEIDKLIGKKRIIIKNIKSYIPTIFQQEIIDKSINYFLDNDKGLLIIPCGVGKTLLSLWITQKLKASTILIGVPNILLLEQWQETCALIFPKYKFLLVKSGISEDNIIMFLRENYENHIVITTYASSFKIWKEHIFDVKIYDETHHLTTSNIESSLEKKSFIHMFSIQSKKQIALTATLKLLQNDNNNNDIISNENIKYFGNIIDKKTLLWAINEKIICDYIIQTFVIEESLLFNELLEDENDKPFLLSAYITLKSINEGHSHHLLIYSNSILHSEIIIKYIEKILLQNHFNIKSDDIFFSIYNSQLQADLNHFSKHRFGIIACVYCLGEGWNFPKLDGVVFSENMSSNIRIVQSALRPCRKNKYEPYKIAKIILPVLYKGEWLNNNDNSDFRKVKEVIYQMSLEDETIIHKIKVFNLELTANSKNEPNQKLEFIGDEYDSSLTDLLKIHTLKRFELGMTYEKARKIIYEKKILTKKEYYDLCEKDCRLPLEPDKIFKHHFTNWIEYLCIPRIYYDLEECKQKVCKYLLEYSDIKKYYLDLFIVCNELYKIDNNFPPSDLWSEYYGKNIDEIIIISNKKRKN